MEKHLPYEFTKITGLTYADYVKWCKKKELNEKDSLEKFYDAYNHGEIVK